jgi:hypothetical protein
MRRECSQVPRCTSARFVAEDNVRFRSDAARIKVGQPIAQAAMRELVRRPNQPRDALSIKLI